MKEGTFQSSGFLFLPVTIIIRVRVCCCIFASS